MSDTVTSGFRNLSFRYYTPKDDRKKRFARLNQHLIDSALRRRQLDTRDYEDWNEYAFLLWIDRLKDYKENAQVFFFHVLNALLSARHGAFAIAAAPSSRPQDDWPLARICRMAVLHRPEIHDLTRQLRRAYAVPTAVRDPSMRDVSRQYASLTTPVVDPSIRQILIVDDVRTSGATLLACARRLQDAAASGTSIATLAFAETTHLDHRFPLLPRFGPTTLRASDPPTDFVKPLPEIVSSPKR